MASRGRATDKIVREIIDRFEDKPVVRPEPGLAGADKSRVPCRREQGDVVDKKGDYPIYLHWLALSACPSKPQGNRKPTPLRFMTQRSAAVSVNQTDVLVDLTLIGVDRA